MAFHNFIIIMGRNKRLYPTGKYRLMSNKASENKIVMLEYTYGNIACRLSMNLCVRKKDWNPKGNNNKGEFKQSYGISYKGLNRTLAMKVADMDEKIRRYVDEHPHCMNANVINNILHNKPTNRQDQGKDFVAFVIDRLTNEYHRHKIGISVLDNVKCNMNSFTKYLAETGKGTYKQDAIYLGDISEYIVNGYIDWRIQKGNSEATINHSLTPIIKACQYASEIGLLSKNKVAHIKDCRFRQKLAIDETQCSIIDKYLTIEQLKELFKYASTCSYERRKEYIEMFFFSYCAGGLRLSDIATLRWDEVDFDNRLINKVIIKNRTSSCGTLQIPLNDYAYEILQRWRDRRQGRKFVFDLVKDDIELSDEVQLKKARMTADKCINQSLNKVGKELGLPFCLSFHAARHSFAVAALNNPKTENRMDPTIISRLLGHSSIDVTMKVYAKHLPNTLNSEIKKLPTNFLYDA